MKRKLILYLFLSIVLFGLYQCENKNKNQKIVDVFNKAHDYYTTSEKIDTTNIKNTTELLILKHTKKDFLKKSLDLFENIEKEYPNFSQKTRVMLNIALISKKRGDYLKSIKYCNKVIESNDSLSKNNLIFKRLASFYLSEIYLKKKEYDNSLKSLKKIQDYSKNIKSNNIEFLIQITNQYSKIYIGKGNFNKALDFVLPYILYDKLIQNSELSNITVDLINKLYSKKEINKEISNVFKTKNKSDLRLFNRKINIPNFDFFEIKKTGSYNELMELEKVKKLLKTSKTYEKLIKKAHNNKYS